MVAAVSGQITARTFSMPGVRTLSLTVRGLGLVASIGLVVAVSAFASHRMSLRLAVILIIALTVFCVLVFKFGLGLPMRLVGPWLGG